MQYIFVILDRRNTVRKYIPSVEKVSVKILSKDLSNASNILVE